jgi:hypothetical protein
VLTFEDVEGEDFPHDEEDDDPEDASQPRNFRRSAGRAILVGLDSQPDR